MISEVVKQQQKILDKYLDENPGSYIFRKEINRIYLNQKSHENKDTYINIIRNYKQKNYHESSSIISLIFASKFSNLTFQEAIQDFIKNDRIDPENARAEWKAYFEYRFKNAIHSYFIHYFPEHWLSVNFSIFSFILEKPLPLYRAHINLKTEGDSSPFNRRVDGFKLLTRFQKRYSTVWEIISNNITSIFYFDKTSGSPMEMVIYEIDPDVQPAQSQVNAKYINKISFANPHRKTSILNLNENSSPENVFYENRSLVCDEDNQNYGFKEREFQYSVMRFFIRSGILDPKKVAYYIKDLEYSFFNLLESNYSKLNELNNDKEAVFFKKSTKYQQFLYEELQEIKSYEQLSSIYDFQYKSTLKRLTKTKRFEDHAKYSTEDNEQLDLLISLFDLFTPEVLDVRLSIFEAGFFYLTQAENSIAHIYWIPIIINWKNQLTGGAVFVNSDKRIGEKNRWLKEEGSNFYKDGSDIKTKEINSVDEKVPQDLITLLYKFSGLFADKQIGEIEETLRPAQERAAAVSIMSRNISHNIGSHVLSYLKNMLSDEQVMLRGGVFDKILELSGEKLDWHESLRANNPVFISPYLRSLGRIIGYFQERQDFIGTFASDRNLFFSPILFWEDIISNFYGEREFSSEQKGILGKTKNLALDFIVFSEEYQEKDMLIESYFVAKDAKDDQELAIDKQNDIRLALPAGSTGRQGMYTILENLIRNTAKHGVAKSKRKDHKINVRITLRELAEDNTLYQVEMLDNSGMVSDTSLTLIQNALTRSLVGKDGNPNEQHKGIKEIQIAAGWLRGILPHELNAKKGDKTELLAKYPVLSASRGIHPETQEDGLQYTFYLRRTKFALLIVKDNSENKYEELFKTHKLLDWDVITFDAANEGSFNPPQIYYQFILVHENLTPAGEKVHRTILKKCSVRVMAGWKDDYFEHTSLKDKPDYFDLQSLIYAMWLDYPLDRKQSNQLSQFNLVLHPDQKNWSISGLNAEPIKGQLKIGIGSRHIESGENRIPDLLEIMPSGIPNQYILFGSHLDLNIHYDELKKRRRSSLNTDIFLFKDYLYIEGISGGNSTDRLLHREKKDHLWWCKMMETALTKVIIIDERTWKNYRGGSLEDIERNYDRLRKKNIHVLTLEYRNDEHLHLLDLKDQTVALLDELGNAQFIDEAAKSQYHESHFITLHQGLLERALKHCEKGVVQLGDEQAQVNFLLEQLRKNLMQAKFRLCIHSGRSKTHVLPEHTAFIQLSALESALQDCKLTLCELFYSSIQEK